MGVNTDKLCSSLSQWIVFDQDLDGGSAMSERPETIAMRIGALGSVERAAYTQMAATNLAGLMAQVC